MNQKEKYFIIYVKFECFLSYISDNYSLKTLGELLVSSFLKSVRYFYVGFFFLFQNDSASGLSLLNENLECVLCLFLMAWQNRRSILFLHVCLPRFINMPYPFCHPSFTFMSDFYLTFIFDPCRTFANHREFTFSIHVIYALFL